MVRLCFEDEGPQRQDLCANCGKTVGNQPGGIFWKRAWPADGDSRPVVDYIFLQEMFGRMLERDEDVYRRLSYLVGLVLIRKRYLRLKSFSSRDGREVMIVTRGAGQPEQIVPAPFLTAEDMVDTREMLTRLLSADLPDGDLPEPAERAERSSEAGEEQRGAEPNSDPEASPDGSGGGQEPSGSAMPPAAENN